MCGVRAATAAPPPMIKSSTSAASLLQFQAVSTDEVIAAVRALPDKCCLLDPLQTKLFKTVVDLNAPFIAEVFNRSLSTGHVPDNFKTAYITPRLKKTNMDPVDPSSYRPISNWCGSLRVGCWHTCVRLACCHDCSLLIVPTTPLKRPC